MTTAKSPDDKRRRVITTARTVFLKYGYDRVTMSDLAKAAKMSRPALYLLFPRKEDVFRGVIRQLTREISDEVHRGLGSIKSPIDRLKFTCEVWMIRPFDWVSESPEAKEIYEGSHAVAADVVAESMQLFEQDLSSAIELLPKGTLPRGVSAAKAAGLLAGAIVGIKTTCASSAELRDKVNALIGMMF